MTRKVVSVFITFSVRHFTLIGDSSGIRARALVENEKEIAYSQAIGIQRGRCWIVTEIAGRQTKIKIWKQMLEVRRAESGDAEV
jgi:hypothetical protein